MLRGTADVAALAQHAATLTEYFAEPIVLDDVTLFQMVMEMHNGAREAVLPPSLHPTIPSTLSMQVWRVGASPWGAFALAVARVSCRGGVRARGFTTAAIASTDAACRGLTQTVGYPARRGDVHLMASYSAVEARVRVEGREAFRAAAIDPVPMGPDDVQYTGTLNLVQVPEGLRLLQIEFQVEPSKVERLQPRLEAFEAGCWGDDRLDPYFPVTAAVTTGRVIFPPPRFLLKTDELAFTGTESIRRGRRDE